MSRMRYNQRSSREIRRANEREQKRQEKKAALDAWWRLPPEERQKRLANNEAVERIERNGITIEDLDRKAREGFVDGAKQGAENTMRNIYAAVALVMHENYGFGRKRLRALLNAVDEKVMYALENKELVQQAWDDIGLKLTFDGDPLDERITEKEDV